MLNQDLTGLDTTRTYQLTLYYDLHSAQGVQSCTLTAALGAQDIYSKTLSSADDPRPLNWKGPFSVTVTPAAAAQTLSFRYSCVPTGSASTAYTYIFLDDLSFGVLS